MKQKLLLKNSKGKQPRRRQPNTRGGWVMLHSMFPMPLEKYQHVMKVALNMDLNSGGHKIVAVRREPMRQIEPVPITFAKMHMKLLRLYWESPNRKKGTQALQEMRDHLNSNKLYRYLRNRTMRR